MRRRPERLTRPEPAEAAEHLSSYTYGTILVLAALVVTTPDEVESGAAALLVAGIGVSTFVAHVFSDALGRQVIARDGDETGASHVLRGSIPILSAMSLPLALMVAAALGWPEPVVAQRLAEIFCIARIALTPIFVSRYRGRPVSVRTWVACLALAVVAMGVVAVKIILTH